MVVISLGEGGGIAKDTRTYHGRSYRLKEVNRLGAGDAFCAGFIYGYLKGGAQAGLNYGCAMAALKHTIPQNVPLVYKRDVENLIRGTMNRTYR